MHSTCSGQNDTGTRHATVITTFESNTTYCVCCLVSGTLVDTQRRIKYGRGNPQDDMGWFVREPWEHAPRSWFAWAGNITHAWVRCLSFLRLKLCIILLTLLFPPLSLSLLFFHPSSIGPHPCPRPTPHPDVNSHMPSPIRAGLLGPSCCSYVSFSAPRVCIC